MSGTPRQDQQQQQQQLQQHPSSARRTAEARAAFEATLQSVGSNLDNELRERAKNLHSNATVLDKQEDELRKATANLARQNDQWQKIADQAREGLKEIGDVQNWAEVIERDLLIVEETLRMVEERDEEVGGEEGEGEEGEGEGEDGRMRQADDVGQQSGCENGAAGGKAKKSSGEGGGGLMRRWW